MKEKTVYTTKEAAKHLGISPTTIYRMEKQDLISSIKTPGGQRRFSRESIEEYLKESQNFEAPQNPSRFKKTASMIKEAETTYIAKPSTLQNNEVFFHTDSITIYNADILKTNSINKNFIDLIVTSPPYNLDIKYNSHDDALSYDDYLSFMREWITHCYEFIKDDGRFCLNIPLDKNKGGQQSVYADITVNGKIKYPVMVKKRFHL